MSNPKFPKAFIEKKLTEEKQRLIQKLYVACFNLHDANEAILSLLSGELTIKNWQKKLDEITSEKIETQTENEA